MTILPASYLPSVEYFAALLRGDCVIDLGEHYIKRSERNRARILTPNGVESLSVQLVRANRPRTPMREMRIDYSKRWQHQHWGALTASYKGSPYFDHYAERLRPFYERRFDFLAEYNLALVELLCTAARVPMPRISESYVEATPSDLDLRPKCKAGPAFLAEPYFQVFSDRLPFAPNLSFADLLFAEGPASCAVLARCRYAE